ncbi:hypothetical protein [Silvibacterium acidisoli]|uniref:hypothetical protein n=1 Tax=Acidobacteriaceae bacterium ZG23-2 TaxID=2883246 RepID=UPI00406C7527
MKFVSAVVNFFLDIFFGCRHERLTRPFTLKDETYKVCLECGRHLYYSPITLRPLSNRELRRMRQARTIAVPAVTAEFVPAGDGKVSAA